MKARPDAGRALAWNGMYVLWLAVFFAAALLYLITAQRGVSWQDSGIFQWRVRTGDLAGRSGLALAHPLYVAAAQLLRLVPLGTLETRLNVFSGIGMAVALGNLAVAATLLTGRKWIGFVTAGMLAVTHTAWWLSTIAEVYTWSVAGLTAELVLLIFLLKRPKTQTLCVLAFVNGLGLTIHNFALLPLPVYFFAGIFLVTKRKLAARSLAFAVAAWLVGSGLYLILIIQLAVRTGDFSAAIHSALFGAPGMLNTDAGRGQIRANAGLGALSFVNLLLPLAVVGWVGFRRQVGNATAAALGAITLIHLLFVLNYSVPDQFLFLLPTLTMISLAAAVGIAVLEARGPGWRRIAISAGIASLGLPPIFYASAPALVRRAGVEISRARELPFRNELRYWLVPWKHNEDSAERFARAALLQTRPGDLIIADETAFYPLKIIRDRDRIGSGVLLNEEAAFPPDLQRGFGRFQEFLGERQIYVVSPVPGYTPPQLLATLNFERRPGEVLYRAYTRGPLAR